MMYSTNKFRDVYDMTSNNNSGNSSSNNEYGKPVKVFLNEEIILDDYLLGEIVNPKSHYFTEESVFTKKVFDSAGDEWLYSYQFDVYFKANEVEIL